MPTRHMMQFTTPAYIPQHARAAWPPGLWAAELWGSPPAQSRPSTHICSQHCSSLNSPLKR